MKVLYLAQHLTVGGAEELLLGVAANLNRERFEVVVGCLTREGVVAQELRRAGVRVVLLPGEPGPRDPLSFARLLRFIRAERPDLVHTFLLNAGLYGRPAAWLAAVPAIYHAEQNIYPDKSRRHLALEQLLARATTKVIACCQAVGDFYQRQVGLEPRRLEVIYNAVDFRAVEPRADREAARQELGYGAEQVVVGCLGRLTEQKGQDVLLRALARLKAGQPELRLFVAGQGPAHTSLVDQAQGLGLTRETQLLGVRRDRDTLYAAMDIFALPSRWEGLSLALVEAAGIGLPVVATDVGGNGEVVQAGPGTWLIPSDDEDALAEALQAAYEQVLQRRSSGESRLYPRSVIREQFSLARHLEQLERSYCTSLGVDSKLETRNSKLV
jgi:glycosyltransferase involved in cell wall biosynthesis